MLSAILAQRSKFTIKVCYNANMYIIFPCSFWERTNCCSLNNNETINRYMPMLRRENLTNGKIKTTVSVRKVAILLKAGSYISLKFYSSSKLI